MIDTDAGNGLCEFDSHAGTIVNLKKYCYD